jgi:hypothetical protein
MTKSYVAKTTIHFVDFEFYVRPGDVLVHDTQNQNRLTVYRNGQIVKVVKQNPLGIVALLKNNFVKELEAKKAPPSVGVVTATAGNDDVVRTKPKRVPKETVAAPPPKPATEEPLSVEFVNSTTTI